MMIFHLIKWNLIATFDAFSSNVAISVAQHFLLSAKAKTLSLATIFRMSDADAEATFRKVRWRRTAESDLRWQRADGLRQGRAMAPNALSRSVMSWRQVHTQPQFFVLSEPSGPGFLGSGS
jgi:hypothetical protein